MKILNFGSLNIDHVYQVEHISRPGETISSHSYRIFAGGKGANQTAALARAGAQVFHAGQVGPEGTWLIDKLAGMGADMRFTHRGTVPTGHAVIQVEASGQNSIILYPGANHALTREFIEATLDYFSAGDIILLQNEINEISYLIEQAIKRKLRICFNPAPCGPEVREYPLERSWAMVVNETEGMALAGTDQVEGLLDSLVAKWPQTEIVLTLGESGVRYRSPSAHVALPAVRVQAVDTTGAGDTFIGYFLAGRAAGWDPRQALRRASQAAALCVTRPGAMDSIPEAAAVDNFAASANAQECNG